MSDQVRKALEKALIRCIHESSGIRKGVEPDDLDTALWMQELSLRRMLKEWYGYGEKHWKREQELRKRRAEKKEEEELRKKFPEVKIEKVEEESNEQLPELASKEEEEEEEEEKEFDEEVITEQLD